MQLKDLLTLPIYADAVVVAGQGGLLHSVEALTIMDAPDIIHYLKPRELLLTTGYAMKDQPEALLALVENMSRVGCAGLAIKTKRFMTALPSDVLRRANELHFPIIELSLEHSLGDISNQSLSFILEKRTDELHYALTTHKQLSQMIMQGKQTGDIIEALAALIGAPVMLVDARGETRHRSPRLSEEEAGRWLEAIRPRLDSTPGIAAPHTSRADTAALSAVSADSALAGEERPDDRFQADGLELLPIFTFQLEGYLVTVAQDSSPQLQNLTKHAMEQAANVIGLELMKNQAVKERSRRYKNEFFSSFVDGRIISEQELLHRCQYYNLLDHPLYICAVANCEGRFRDSGEAPPLQTDGRTLSESDRRYFALKTEFAKLDLRFVLFSKNDHFCFIIAPHAELERSQGKESKLAESLKLLTERMYSEHGIPVSIGIGNPVSQLHDVPVSYNEAAEALQSGYTERKKQFVQTYRAKNFSYLLRMLPKEELKEYYEETFKELLRIEERERGELLKTLNIFYSTHCQLAETAKQLFVHRNTVTYRLDKCERLTGRNLRDPVESLRFRTAFAMEPLIHEA